MRHQTIIRHALMLFAFGSILTFSGCGGDNGSAEGPQNPGSAVDASTTATASGATTATENAEETATVPDGQLDFFAERYISSQDRLQRRQVRIKQQLSGGGAGVAN